MLIWCIWCILSWLIWLSNEILLFWFGSWKFKCQTLLQGIFEATKICKYHPVTIEKLEKKPILWFSFTFPLTMKTKKPFQNVRKTERLLQKHLCTKWNWFLKERKGSYYEFFGWRKSWYYGFLGVKGDLFQFS